MIGPEGSIKVGIDYDGVIVKKAHSLDFVRRPTKLFLPTLHGVIEGIDYLNVQSDVDVLGIYTVRPRWLREIQTREQVERRKIPIKDIIHAKDSSKGKIEALLTDVWVEGGVIEQIVLIDDNVQKVVDGARQLYDEKPQLRYLLARFTLAAFNPQQPEQIKGMIVPGVVHIVEMRDWADVVRMLDHVRFHAFIQR